MAPDVATLLREHEITAPETPIEHNGFSGARLSRIVQDDQSYILKRVSLATDWIMRGLDDTTCREAEFAVSAVCTMLPDNLRIPYVGAARDGSGWAILSRDIFPLRFGADGVEPPEAWDAILGALADMHAVFWRQPLDVGVRWCPWRERLTLLSPAGADSLAAEGIDFGAPAGWRVFGRIAEAVTRDAILGLLRDPSPLMRKMDSLSSTLCHADAKIGNMGLDGVILWLFDWSDVSAAPVGLEIGYLLAVNSSRLPWPHDETLARYAAHLERRLGAAQFAASGWPEQEALAILSGIMTLGWAKAWEAEAGSRGEFDWWCDRVPKAADVLGL